MAFKSYDIVNPSETTPRAIHAGAPDDGLSMAPIFIRPGQLVENVTLADHVVRRLRRFSEVSREALIIREARQDTGPSRTQAERGALDRRVRERLAAEAFENAALRQREEQDRLLGQEENEMSDVGKEDGAEKPPPATDGPTTHEEGRPATDPPRGAPPVIDATNRPRK